MTFDTSRVRFDPTADFLGVVMQQGRVQLDADWNEQAAQVLRRIHAGTLDTLGRAVVPRETPDGFRIEAAAGTLAIGRGRIYVDGLLAENHGAAPTAWDASLAELRGTAAVPYDAQPYYPDPPALPGGGPHLVYLDVWQREVTHLHDPSLVEPALGVDTTGRLQTVWQVKVLPRVGDATCATPDAELAGWAELVRPSAGRLTTLTGAVAGDPDPCLVPPGGDYQGLENQHYRVEIHDPGPAGTASFKWSRDNGTVATAVEAIDAARTRLVVESVGRDEVLRVSDGDWVEVTDDWRELHGLPGELRRVASGGGVDDATRTVTLEQPLTAGLFPTDGQGRPDAERHTRLRRWDQAGRVLRADGTVFHDLDAPGAGGAIPVPPPGTALRLEHGIQLRFDADPAGGAFRAADAWSFAARAADASVELLDRAPPRTTHHHYARLAIVTFPDGETDCRTLWPPPQAAGGCDCTACVTAEGHAAGTATLQRAVDEVKARGGTVCLGPGVYTLREPLRIADARSLRVRGQGWRTLLVCAAPGPAVVVEGSVGVALENLAVAGSAGGDVAGVVAVRDVMGCELRRVGIVALGRTDARSVALGLAGHVLRASARECLMAADVGVAGGAEKGGVLLTASLDVSDNVLWCERRGVSLERRALHFADTRIAGNLVLGCREAGVLALGGVLPASSLRVAANTIQARGSGIVAGTDGTWITDNDVSTVAGGGRAAAGDGIALVAGLDPSGIDHCHVVGNRVAGVPGHGIALRTRVGSAIVKQNVIDGPGGGGIVMEDAASAGHLAIDNNQLLNVAAGFNAAVPGVAAIRVLAARHADVAGNLVDGFARDAVQPPARVAIQAVATERLRVAGNRLQGIGPAGEHAGETVAVELLAPAAAFDVAGNVVRREAADDEKLAPARWWGVRLRPPAGAVELAPELLWLGGAAAVLLTRSRLRVLAPRRAHLGLRGNHLAAQAGAAPLVEVEGADHCALADNLCERQGAAAGARGAMVVELRDANVIAGGNRLRGDGDLPVMHLQKCRFTVLGNLTSGPILVDGRPLPDPWAPLNALAP